MKLGFDLDGVLLNTEALKELIQEHGLHDAVRSPELFEQLQELVPDFDLGSFVYDDVVAFLEAHGGQIEIITSYRSKRDADDPTFDELYRAFQEYKLTHTGIGDQVAATHVTGAEKSATLAERQAAAAAAGESFYFIDDSEAHLAEARELGIRCAKMVRPTYTMLGFERAPETSEFPVVHSLQEFFALCQTWEQETLQKAA